MNHFSFARLLSLVGLLGGLLLLAACQGGGASENNEGGEPTAVVLINGLNHPVGLDSRHGHLFIAEEGSGEPDLSAAVAVLTADGQAGRLISGLPSGRDSGDLSGVPFAKLDPAGQLLYTSHFNSGRLLTLPLADHWQGTIFTLPDTPYTPEALGETMTPLNQVQLINPFDLVFDETGEPIVSDASQNGVARRTAVGQTQFFHRFAPLPNPSDQGKVTIDPVPTGITRLGDEYLVTLTGGCPYPAQSGQIVAINDERAERIVATGLNMPIAITAVSSESAPTELWVLEFAQFDPEASCFSGAGYLPYTGQLSRLYPDGRLEPRLTGLDFPAGLAVGEDGSLYISELLDGRVLHIQNYAALGKPTPLADILTSDLAQHSLPPASVSHFNPSGTKTEDVRAVPDPIEPDEGTAVVALDTVSPTDPTPITFRNVAREVGLDFQHAAFATHIPEDPVAMMGGGLCWLDFDNDGWLDLYLVNSYAEDEEDYWQSQGGLPTNALYHNQQGKFVDISAASGTNLTVRGNGCLAADFNGNGFTDIYLTADGPNKLLWNNGDGTFTEGAAEAGVDAPEWSAGAAVADLSGNGYPDLFVTAYIDLDNKIPNPSGAFPQDFYGLPDRLYLNNGDGTFTDITAVSGLQHEERSLGAIFSDLNDDGRLDLYIANDGQPNRLYLNLPRDDQPSGFILRDITRPAGVGDSGSGMGVVSADYDNDGRFDLFVTNWEAELNALYRNEGDLNFWYSTHRIGISGLGNGMTGWGAAWADFDHDTDSDLLVVNGRVPVTSFERDPELVRFYGNRLAQGMPNSMREWTNVVGLGHDGLGTLLARGSAVADFDNDGDLDIAINSIGGEVVLLRNEGATGNWLIVDFGGFYPGAQARLTLPDGRTLARERHVGSSYLATEDPRLHFGLGNLREIDELWLSFGDGYELTLRNVLVNQILQVERELATYQPRPFVWADLPEHLGLGQDGAELQGESAPSSLTPNNLAGDWYDLQMEIIRETPGFTPPVTARALAYTGIALYETARWLEPDRPSLAGQLRDLDQLPEPEVGLDYHWPTAVNHALAYITHKMYPNMSGKNAALLNQLRNSYDGAFESEFEIEEEVYARSVAYGTAVGQAIYQYSLSDGGDLAYRRNFPPNYSPPIGPGLWEPTPPTYTGALQPTWQTNRPFILPSPESCLAPPPVPFSTEPGTPFYEQARTVYDTVQNLTPEQEEIALFWADEPGESPTPPGHSINILTQILRQQEATLPQAAEAYALAGIGLNDAFISVWHTKYVYNLIRPITYIQQVIDPSWNNPTITDPVTTPPFPEYTSGHAVQAGVTEGVLSYLFGDELDIVDATHERRGFAPRQFSSFSEMALEAATSRIYGGIHYPMASEQGLLEGECVAGYVNTLTTR